MRVQGKGHAVRMSVDRGTNLCTGLVVMFSDRDSEIALDKLVLCGRVVRRAEGRVRLGNHSNAFAVRHKTFRIWAHPNVISVWLLVGATVTAWSKRACFRLLAQFDVYGVVQA